jgi:hypothetical protein
LTTIGLALSTTNITKNSIVHIYRPQQVDINISGKDRIGSILNLWNASWDLIAKTIG